jgi:hypothetical protein
VTRICLFYVITVFLLSSHPHVILGIISQNSKERRAEALLCTLPPLYTVQLESRCAHAKVLEVMSTSVYTSLNPFNFICKHFQQICGQKVTVHSQKVMSTNVDTGLNPFNSIRKHFLQICLWDFMHAVIAVWNSLIMCGWSQYPADFASLHG